MLKVQGNSEAALCAVGCSFRSDGVLLLWRCSPADGVPRFDGGAAELFLECHGIAGADELAALALPAARVAGGWVMLLYLARQFLLFLEGSACVSWTVA